MGESKRKKTKAGEPISEAEALGKIDMSQITPGGILELVRQIGDFKRKIAELEANALKPHIHTPMTVDVYNWYVESLNAEFNNFSKALQPPANIDVNAPKLLILSPGGES